MSLIESFPSGLLALKAKFRVPLAVAAAFALATALGSLFVKNQYTSEAKILLLDQRGTGSLGGIAAAAANLGLGGTGQEGSDAAYVDILNSRTIRETLLTTTYTFHERPWMFGALRTRQESLQSYIGARTLDRALLSLRQRIFISRDPKTRTILLAVETTSADLSQQVVQRMLALMDEFLVVKSRTRSSLKAGFSERRLAEARLAMDQAEASLRLFGETNRNYLLSPEPAIRMRGVRLENELKLRTQLVTTLALNYEQALLDEKNDLPVLNILEPGNLPQEKTRPSRGAWTVLVFVLSAGLAIALQSREWLLSHFQRTR